MKNLTMSDDENVWLGKAINTKISKFTSIQQSDSSDSSDSEDSGDDNSDHITISDSEGEHTSSQTYQNIKEDSDYLSDERGQISDSDEENSFHPQQTDEEESDDSNCERDTISGSSKEDTTPQHKCTNDKWTHLLKQMSNRENVKRQTCVVTPYRHEEDKTEDGQLDQGIPNTDLANIDPEDAAVYRGEYVIGPDVPEYNVGLDVPDEYEAETDVDEQINLRTDENFDNIVQERDDYEQMEQNQTPNENDPNNIENNSVPMEWRDYENNFNVQERERNIFDGNRFSEAIENYSNEDDMFELQNYLQHWMEQITARETRRARRQNRRIVPY